MTLRTDRIAVRRGKRMVLEGIDLVLEEGQLTAICGPNGAGKSTLLSALAGLVPVVDGEVMLADRAIAAMAARKRARSIGYLAQQTEAAWDISVASLVALGRLPWRAVPGRPARAGRDADDQAIAQAMEVMELTELADRPVSQLSGGERARAMMARVLAGQPRWLLADEPLASLDLAHQARLIAALKAQARAGRGVIVVMHDLSLAMNHADRVVVLNEGHVAADDTPQAALSSEVLARVWQIAASWVEVKGTFALAVA